mgnify:FL=1
MTSRSQFALRLVTASLFSIPLIWIIHKVGVNAPFQDELTFSNLYSQVISGESLGLRELMSSHNGHPLLIPKLLMGLTLKFELPWILLMYAQVALLFVAYLFATARLNDIKSLSDYCVLFGLAFSIFSARQWENLYWAMQLAFPLYLALSFSAFFYAQRYWSSRRTSDLCVALALALCAATSNGAGIFTLILTCIAVSLARPNARDLTLSIAFAVSGTIFFILSQSASTNGGIGASVPDLQQFVRHAAQMLALTWLDFGEHKTVAEIFAVVFALVLVGTVVRTFKYRSLYTFELLSISIGLLVLLGVSYARVSAGIFQPDASRYIPLVIPIAVGSILIFRKSNWNFFYLVCL